MSLLVAYAASPCQSGVLKLGIRPTLDFVLLGQFLGIELDTVQVNME
jgi:hypothetical protein